MKTGEYKKKKKVEFSTNWDDTNNKYKNDGLLKSKEESIIKGDGLSESMKESIMNDKGFIAFFNLDKKNKVVKHNFSNYEVVTSSKTNVNISSKGKDSNFPDYINLNGKRSSTYLNNEMIVKLTDKKDSSCVDSYTELSDNILVSSKNSVTVIGFRENETVIRPVYGLGPIEVKQSDILNNKDNSSNILYSKIDTYDINWSFSQYMEFYSIQEILSLLPILFICIVYLYYKIKALFEYCVFYYRDFRFISFSVLPIFPFPEFIKRDYDINLSFSQILDYYNIQGIKWLIPIFLLSILYIYSYRKYNFYFKGKEFISVVPVSTSNNTNQSNVERSPDMDIVLEETKKVNEIINRVIERKGHLDSKDIDGVRKILNQKLRDKGLSERFFANVTLRKEDPFDVDKYIVQNMIDQINNRQGTYTVRELNEFARNIESVLVNTGLYPRFTVNIHADIVMTGGNSTINNQNNQNNQNDQNNNSSFMERLPENTNNSGNSSSSNTTQLIYNPEKTFNYLDLNNNILNLPFGIMIEFYFIPELISLLPIIILSIIFLFHNIKNLLWNKKDYLRSLVWILPGVNSNNNIFSDDLGIKNINEYNNFSLWIIIGILLILLISNLLYNKFVRRINIFNKYKLLSIVPGSTLKGKEIINNNNEDLTDLEKGINIVDKANDVLIHLVNRKGYLDCADLDSIKKLINHQFQKEGLDNLFINATLKKEQTPKLDIDLMMAQALIDGISNKTFSGKEWNTIINSINEVFTETGLSRRFNVQMNLTDVNNNESHTRFIGNNSNSVSGNNNNNISGNTNINPSIQIREEGAKFLNVGDKIDLPFGYFIEWHYVPELISIIPLMLLCIIFIWTKLIKV